MYNEKVVIGDYKCPECKHDEVIVDNLGGANNGTCALCGFSDLVEFFLTEDDDD